MEQLLKYELEVKVFKYTDKEERDKHVEKMQKDGWSVKREGRAIFLADSTISEMRDEGNYDYVAEFYKEKKTEGNTKGVEYETELYWARIYNPRD